MPGIEPLAEAGAGHLILGQRGHGGAAERADSEPVEVIRVVIAFVHGRESLVHPIGHERRDALHRVFRHRCPEGRLAGRAHRVLEHDLAGREGRRYSDRLLDEIAHGAAEQVATTHDAAIERQPGFLRVKPRWNRRGIAHGHPVVFRCAISGLGFGHEKGVDEMQAGCLRRVSTADSSGPYGFSWMRPSGNQKDTAAPGETAASRGARISITCAA